jgi:hypothetical protein
MMVDIRSQVVTEKTLPTAALIPFSLSQEDFLEGWNRTHSSEELQESVKKMEAAGIDEVIVAYRELADLQTAGQLIK